MLNSGLYRILVMLAAALLASASPMRMVLSSLDNSAVFCLGQQVRGRRKRMEVVRDIQGQMAADRAGSAAPPSRHAGASDRAGISQSPRPQPGSSCISFWQPLLARAAQAVRLVLIADRPFLDSKGYRRALVHFV